MGCSLTTLGMTNPECKPLCRLADVPDGGAKGVEIETGGRPTPVVLLREGDSVFAYLNICPHQGRDMSFAPGRFMVRDGVLVCANHGASFRVRDGRCVGGPCRGACLRPVPVLVHDGAVQFAEKNENAE